MRIPRIVHQIRLGPDPLPADEIYTASWRACHPRWEVRLWQEDDVPGDCRRPEVHQRLRHPAERAAILRLELLWRYGGVYVDTNVECLRSLEPLLDDVDLFLGDLEPGRTGDTVLGAVPGHPLIARALDEIRPVEWHGVDPRDGTGARFLDGLVRPERDRIAVFPPAVFHPKTDEERVSAYAVSHGGESSFDLAGLRARLVQAEARQEAAEQALRDVQRELEIVRTGSLRARAGVRGRGVVRRLHAGPRLGKPHVRSLRWVR